MTNAVTQGGNLAAATSQDSQITQTATPPKPKLTAWQEFKAGLVNVWDTVKWSLVAVIGAFGVGAAICALAPTSAAGLWLAGLVKRKFAKPATV